LTTRRGTNKGIVSDLHFSHSYAEARSRFIEAARAVDASVHAYAIDATAKNDLTIDVAIIGADIDPALVVSSGVHGVEGFFGSAVQLALLERLKTETVRRGIRYVLIHAVNPYGFAHLRRVNEDNIDLNRNFMASAADYAGAPSGYAELNGLLNPESPPSRLEPFKAKALWQIWRTGLPVLKETIARGQYEYPRGLFYGGKIPSASTQIVQNHCDAWLAASQHILHIDLHTGLGSHGNYKLLITESDYAERREGYAETFGVDHIEPLTKPDGMAYRVAGQWGPWMQQRFHKRDYRFVGAEFGTYDVIRVLAALRAENRAHHYCAPDSPAWLRAKDELRECFCPELTAWRHQVIDSGLRVVEQAGHALLTL
jgi:Protein of unknown function (DUF2817)